MRSLFESVQLGSLILANRVYVKVYPWGTQWPPPTGAGNFAGEKVKKGIWPASLEVLSGYNDGYPRTSPVGSFGVILKRQRRTRGNRRRPSD
jgi:hypothetical protein